MASAVDSRLAYARLSAVATASRLPTANRGSNNSYTTSWDTTPVSPHSSIAGTMFDNQLVRPIPIEVLGRDEPDTVRSAITSPLSIEDQDLSVVHFRT